MRFTAPVGPPLHHEGPAKIRFSRTEILHLLGSVVLLSIAFAAVMSPHDFPRSIVPSPLAALSSLLAVSTGFVLHELAHKIVAQRWGHWAEFRAQFKGLGLSVLLAVGLKFLFAAPGAVLIQGRVTPKENGIISLVGPATNLVIAWAAWPFARSLNPESDPVSQVFHVVAFVNALLAVFNLIPAFILDGRKVWWWSKTAYFLAMGAALSTFVLLLFFLGPPNV